MGKGKILREYIVDSGDKYTIFKPTHFIHIFFLNAKIVSLKKNIMHTTKCGSIHFLKNIYLFIWLCWVLVVACRIFSYGMWDLVP